MRTITVPAPHVPHGPTHVPENVADADYLRSAVRNIENLSRGERLWGSNLTATVIKLLNDSAWALAAGVAPDVVPAVAPAPHAAQISALMLQLADSGDITPMGARMVDRVIRSWGTGA